MEESKSMEESKQSSGVGLGSDASAKGKYKKNKNKKVKSAAQLDTSPDPEEVLLSLPGGFKYKLPGKRQRIWVASVVIGLNALLILAVILYFYNPGFQDFIYNVGRD